MSAELLAAVYGIISALAYGSGDFTGGFASKKSSVYAVIVLSQIAGLVMYALLALIFQEAPPPLEDLPYAMMGGLIGVFGLLSLYTSLSRGQMGIAAPVAGVVTAALPVIAAFVTQGLPKPAVLLGFAIGLVAVWLIARSPDAGRIQPRVLVLPVIAGICFGLGFLLFVRASMHATFIPLATARVFSVSGLGLFVLLTRKPFHVTSARALPLIALGGLLDAAGNGFFVLAAQAGRIDIAAVLSSLYPAATVLLAWIVLRERLSRTQGIGVLAALIAIALIVA
ncbi:MAG: DMT family transporter [Anaerolineae bacterium]